MEKTAIVFISYNRPQYFSQCLESFKKQQGNFPECSIVLAQDYRNEYTKEVEQCIQLFRISHPNGTIVLPESTIGFYNKGIAYNYYDVAKIMFSKDYKRLIFIEDDMILSPYFLDTMFKMIEKFGDDRRIGILTVSGENILSH